VAIEDKRFYTHRGVDPLRTLKAGLGYLRGNPTCGGSTITQQLVKNLTGRTEHTPERKLTEIFTALDLEKRADKETVLEAYLNIINLAEGCFGVGMAAETYFQKSVSDLTLPECAAIAAITNNPARYDPLTHPEANRARRDLILTQMANQGYITEAERDTAIATPLTLDPAPKSDPAPITSWYADMVVSDVIRDLMLRKDYTYAAASRLVYNGGLRIETAMDEDLQRIVETYYTDASHFPAGDKGRPQSSFILIDPETGDILAVAGAVGEKTASRVQSYATDTRRPAGSCI
jgi:penicillin-binding protein 1A